MASSIVEEDYGIDYELEDYYPITQPLQCDWCGQYEENSYDDGDDRYGYICFSCMEELSRCGKCGYDDCCCFPWGYPESILPTEADAIEQYWDRWALRGARWHGYNYQPPMAVS